MCFFILHGKAVKNFKILGKRNIYVTLKYDNKKTKYISIHQEGKD